MRLAFVNAVAIACLVVILTTKPVKAAMEPEELMVRLATGISLKATAPDRRRARRIRRALSHG
jgi:hypothetical protein